MSDAINTPQLDPMNDKLEELVQLSCEAIKTILKMRELSEEIAKGTKNPTIALAALSLAGSFHMNKAQLTEFVATLTPLQVNKDK